jgi:sarcosine oxidase
MGSAVLAHVAKRGKRAIGFEQYPRGHDLGASSGRTRIIRKAYFENPAYVPMLERAYELWAELESETQMKIWDLIGILMVAPLRSARRMGAMESAALHGVPLEEFSREELQRRYPVLKLRANDVGLFEPDAGVIFPEVATQAHLRIALEYGAQARFNTAVRGWQRAGGALEIRLSDGEPIRAERLAICAGPWLADVTPDLDLPLRVQRNVQVWFEPSTLAYRADRFPAFFLDRDDLPAPLYGFPDFGEGVKAAFHAYGATTTPRDIDRNVHAADIMVVCDALNDFMPGAGGRYAFGKACMYTLTPDEHFILDHYPNDRGVVIAGGFSGHGYKFCPFIGEVVSRMLLDEPPLLDTGFLSLHRFNPDQ